MANSVTGRTTLNAPESNLGMPLFRKHGANVLYNSLTNDYDHDEEQTTVTLLYPDDPDEVMNWTLDKEVTE